jgi:phosphoketolase
LDARIFQRSASSAQQLADKLIEHKQYIDKNGQDLPEIRNWKWQASSCTQDDKSSGVNTP